MNIEQDGIGVSDIKSDEQAIDSLHALVSQSSGGVIKNNLDDNIRWKTYRLTVKEVTDDGTFTGYASVFGNIDSDYEVVDKGAFDRTLKNNPHPVVLWNHSTSSPVGFNESGQEDGYGLRVQGRLMLDCEAGRYAYSFLKMAQKVGGRAGLSIGFRGIKWDDVKDKSSGKTCRHWQEVALLEYSVVTFAANDLAFVTAVKSRFDKETREMELKSGTKRVDGVDLPSHCFAYVSDADKTETWKLPIEFPGDDEKTKSHIRNALARFNQAEGIPEDEKPKVLARIRAAAKEHGIDAGENNNDKGDKSMNQIDAASTTDFDTAVAAHQRQRENAKQRSDIEGALYDTLSNIHASERPNDEKKSMVADCYQKYAKAMTDWHHATYFGDTSKAFDLEIQRKSDDEIREIAKAKGGKILDRLMKAVYGHEQALENHKKIVKDLFGNQSGDQGVTTTTEMGSMSEDVDLTEKSAVPEKSEEHKDTTESQVNVEKKAQEPPSGSDSGTHSLLADLRALTTSRLESL